MIIMYDDIIPIVVIMLPALLSKVGPEVQVIVVQTNLVPI